MGGYGYFRSKRNAGGNGFGIGQLPQASIADYPDVVSDILGTSDDLVLAFGLSLGYEDTNASVNQYRVTREKVDAFCRWYE